MNFRCHANNASSCHNQTARGAEQMKFYTMMLHVIGISVLLITAASAETEKITIAGGTGAFMGPLHIAYVKGYFKAEGLDVAMQAYASGKAAVDAMVEGKAELATSAETRIMFAGLRGEKIYVIATLHKTENMAVIARKDRGIAKPQDLKGKRLGVTANTNADFFLDTFLLFHGLSRTETEILNLKPDELSEALSTNRVDAVSVWQPYVIRIQKTMREKGTTFQMKGVYREHYILSGMQEFIVKNPETVKRLLRALVKAERFIREKPDESLQLMADYNRIDKELLSEIWDAYRFSITLDQPLLISLEDEARWAIKNRLTDKTKAPNYLNLLYLDGLKAVKPEGVTVIH
ncbi:MAG: ABC transporter substrate-binding protein [Nitrospirota bacterium]|nr:ABC transporter substrate-binding protein [Nitrospirota bacterium]